MKKIVCDTIPFKSMRYPSAGDYFETKKETVFKIAKMKDWRYVMLVFIHELVEYTIIKYQGIKIKDIDDFDRSYEEARHYGVKAPCGCKPTKTSEPGHDRHAIYREAHCTAEKIERMVAKELGVSWEKYDQTVNSL